MSDSFDRHFKIVSAFVTAWIIFVALLILTGIGLLIFMGPEIFEQCSKPVSEAPAWCLWGIGGP